LWLFWIFLSMYISLFMLSIYQGWLSEIYIWQFCICFFQVTFILISTVAALIYISTSGIWGPPLPVLASFVVCFFIMNTTVNEVTWCVPLICISLTAKDAEHFLMYLLTICTSFRTVHSLHLPICWLIGLFVFFGF
jgi:hypothetical protein